MNKKMTKVLALAMAAAMTLAACSSAPAEKPAESTTPSTPAAPSTPATPAAPAESKDEVKEITDIVLARVSSRELDTFNYLYSQSAENGENLTMLWDGLLQTNKRSQYLPCIAESYETTDGGKNWTFKIREGVKWVDINGEVKADCDAYDFATGLEWVLNYWKNDSNNTSMPMEMIAGASEYYEYTKALTEEEAHALKADEGSKFFEMVGMEVPDANTILYHCITEKPYFYTLGSYSALFPLDQALVDELGVNGIGEMNNESMWYNGPYIMTSFIHGNEKVFEPNPEYWNKEGKRFNTVTVKMVDSVETTYTLFENGEVDYVGLSESMIKTISENPDHPMYNFLVPAWPTAYSYQMHFNFNKMNEDGTEDTNWNLAAANENFRKAIFYGLNLTEYFKRTNALEPLKCENNGFTKNMLVYTSDGTDYADLVKKELGLGTSDGVNPIRFNAEKGAEHKAKAMEELTAAGVTFPIKMSYYIQGSNQSALDTANVLSNTISNYLGDDFLQLEIKTYISSLAQEVRNPQLHSIVVNGWGADYSDPQNFLGQLTYDEPNAYYSGYYNNINKVAANENTQNLIDTFVEFTKMVNEANAVTSNLDERYAAYAKAEAYALDHALVVPMYYNVGFCLTNYNVYGATNSGKMVDWETDANGFTREEMAACMAEAGF